MFDAGLHVHHDHLVAGEHHVGDERPQQGAFGADAPGPAFLDAAQTHELDVVEPCGKRLGQVVHLGIELEKAAHGTGLGFGALEDQVFHFGDRGDLMGAFDAQRRRQVGIGIRIDGQDVLARIVERAYEKGRKSGFADTAFAADRDFHAWVPFELQIWLYYMPQERLTNKFCTI